MCHVSPEGDFARNWKIIVLFIQIKELHFLSQIHTFSQDYGILNIFYINSGVIFNQKKNPLFLQIFSSFTDARAGQPVTQMRSTNSQSIPHGQTQAPPYIFLV